MIVVGTIGYLASTAILKQLAYSSHDARIDEVTALTVEEIHHLKGSLFVTLAHEVLPVTKLVIWASQKFTGAQMTHQALPKFIAPKQMGLTLTAAVGASSLWRPRRLGGSGAGFKAMVGVLEFFSRGEGVYD